MITLKLFANRASRYALFLRSGDQFHSRKLSSNVAQVLRDGTWAAVRETDLTVGDVIQCTLESPKIPADIAVIYVDDEVVCIF